MIRQDDVPIPLCANLLILTEREVHAPEATVIGTLAEKGDRSPFAAVFRGAFSEALVRSSEEPLVFRQPLIAYRYV
jgi:hypothetical protein